MIRANDLAVRISNKARRLLARVPRGMVVPLVDNDLLRTHLSLFDFLAAFTPGREVLFDGDSTAYGARRVHDRSGARVTGIVRSNGMREYARKHFATDLVTFAGTVTGPEKFGTVIMIDATTDLIEEAGGRLTPTGILLAVPSRGEERGIANALREKFRSVRRFAQLAEEPVNLAAQARSRLSERSFLYRELGAEEVLPPTAAAVVLFATDDERWIQGNLHIGSGPVALPGWVNIDNLPYPGVDFLWDLSGGIPFRRAPLIFAEHFIEHLTFPQASAFVRGCREALNQEGVLRLSTPNLDWVWHTSYHPREWSGTEEELRDCFMINRAFRGWGHQFLYNIAALKALLCQAGFSQVTSYTYGISEHPSLQGIERHEQYPDAPALPHVLVVEATGRRGPTDEVPRIVAEAGKFIPEYERDVSVR